MQSDGGSSVLERSRLQASERCCALYIARGTTALNVAEIAAEIGLSERTFYRYFPIKAESVSPVFDATTRRFDDAVRTASPDAHVRDVLREAFRSALGRDVADRTSALFPLVFGDAEMWSVFLRKVHDGERALAPLLAPRLALDPSSIAARSAAAAVASATRLALESMVTTGVDAERTFLQIIDAFASGPLRRT